mgnify:CR=1 FL=1
MNNFKPLNRHLWIEIKEEAQEENESSVLLPKDFQKQESPYALVKVKGIAEDCSHDVPFDSLVVVERHMIKKIKVYDSDLFIIQENYLLGIVN